MDNQPTAPAPSAASIEVPAIPATWPGAFGALKHSKRVIKENLWAILGLTVLNLIFGGLGYKDDSGTGSLLGLVGALLSIWLTLALIMQYFAGVRGEKLGFSDSLKKSAPFYLRSLGATILTVILMFLSILALVIPFFFVLPRFALVNYFIIDRNAGAVEAIKLSWKETKGHSLKVWGIIGATILFAVLCVVLIGIYFLFFYQAALAVLYMFISRTQPATADAPVAQSDPTQTAEEPVAPSSSLETPQTPVATPDPTTPPNQTPTPPTAV